jgi:hypothetical protein
MPQLRGNETILGLNKISPCPRLQNALSPLLLSAQVVVVYFPVVTLWHVILLGSIVVVYSHGPL